MAESVAQEPTSNIQNPRSMTILSRLVHIQDCSPREMVAKWRCSVTPVLNAGADPGVRVALFREES